MPDPSLKAAAYCLAAVVALGLAILAGNAGNASVAALLVCGAFACVILAVLRPRDAQVCRICGNRKVTPQPLCFSCRQRFGVDE